MGLTSNESPIKRYFVAILYQKFFFHCLTPPVLSGSSMDPSKIISAIILSGGLGSRMGQQEKGLIDRNGKPLVSYVIDQLSAQVDDITLNCNRHIDLYEKLGYSVITDNMADFQGPLAGVQASLSHVNHGLCLIAPCDTPSLPADLVSRLYQALIETDSDIAYPICGNRKHYIPSLIRKDLLRSLNNYLETGKRSIRGWYSNQKVKEVDFSGSEQSFINVNTPQLLASI